VVKYYLRSSRVVDVWLSRIFDRLNERREDMLWRAIPEDSREGEPPDSYGDPPTGTAAGNRHQRAADPGDPTETDGSEPHRF